MDTDVVESLVDDLEVDIDVLEKSLLPVLKAPLSASASKLPLLDKAKLCVLTTYAIESILFSALRLNGVDAKNHPVFAELARVKEYFEKIKVAEDGPAKRTTTLNKDAANRFIQAGLSGNDKLDRERAERQTRQAIAAAHKTNHSFAKGTHVRFDQDSDNQVAKSSQPAKTTSKRSELTTKEERRAAKLQRRLEKRSAQDSDVNASKSAPKSAHEAFSDLVEKDSKKKKKKRQKDNENGEEKDHT